MKVTNEEAKGAMGVRRVAVGLLVPLVLALTTVTAGADSSLTTAKVPSAGISVSYPKTWVKVPLTAKQVGAARKAIEKRNPRFAQAFDEVTQQQLAANTKLFAIDLSSSPRTNVNVLVIPGTDAPDSLATFTRGVSDEYSSLGATLIGTTTTKVGSRKAFRADLRYVLTTPAGDKVPVRALQVVLAHGGALVVVTVTGADNDKGFQVIDDVAGRIRSL